MVYVISSLVIPLSKINPLVFYQRIFRVGEAMSYVFVHKLLYISAPRICDLVIVSLFTPAQIIAFYHWNWKNAYMRNLCIFLLMLTI